MRGMSGIGISFGLDRIELVLSELDLFPTEIHTSIDLFVVHFQYGNDDSSAALHQ